MKNTITVLGSGAWGTAIAKHTHSQGYETHLYCRRLEIAKAISKSYENTEYLKGICLKGIKATNDISITMHSDMVFVVVPSQNLRTILSKVIVSDNTPLILCCKGVEMCSLSLMHTVAKECVPNANIMILSGPTFAIEVAKKLPTTITLAGTNTDTVFNTLFNPNFRVYKTNDMVGAEIGGAVKNIIAIACGIVVGKGLGDNAKASLITRSIAEISRLNNA